MNNEPVVWKAYEEVHFNDQYILRWVREGAEYVNRITCDMMEDLKSVVRQQQAEIDSLRKNLDVALMIVNKAELTDEEINDIWLDVFSNNSTAERQLIFARAILRKASESIKNYCIVFLTTKKASYIGKKALAVM